MLGAILGDIVGSPFEFDHNNYKHKDFALLSEKSHFTDDTVMTVAVARGLMAGQGDAPKTFAEVQHEIESVPGELEHALRGHFCFSLSFPQGKIMVYWTQSHKMGGTVMKWGILATGTIAKKFASTVEQMGAEGERIVAVGSRHLESAQAFAQQYGIPRCYDSYEALAADPEVEAIYVATPNTLHYENCKLCLEQGKHVLCEKPFTIDPEQAQKLYRLAEEKHLFLMEAFWIWLLPLYDRLREILAAGTIGELRQITCQYGFVASGARKDRKFDSGLGGGALLDIGIYNLGFLRILTGQDPEKVETKEVHINEYGTDDYSRLALTYPGGCMAESVQTIGQELERNARIVGTKGSIFLPDFQHAETMTLEVEGKEPEVIRCPVDINGFEYEIREASRCVKLGRTGSDRYTPQDSLALTRLMYDTRMSWGMKFAGEV